MHLIDAEKLDCIVVAHHNPIRYLFNHVHLMKELWCYTDNRISIRFEYQWQDADTGQWMRTHGNEHWEFNEKGLMSRRDMSANDYRIHESERSYG